MVRFNKDKYLKKLRFKKYKRYLYIGIPCILVLLIGIYFAYSKFSVFKEEEVVRTTVGEFIHGDVVIGAYVDGKYSTTIPGKNDGYIVDKIVCDNDATASWDNDAWGIVLTNLTKRTKCNVYFKKQLSLTEAITTAMSSNPSMFATDDPDKNVRYIGADPNNYVYFNCSDYNNQSDSTCEKWRIIGVFNNVTKGDGTKENLVKIIRNDSLGNDHSNSYSWDNSDSSVNSGKGVNDWTDADAMKLLNPGYDSETVGGSLYYNAKSGTCYYRDNNATTPCDFTAIGLKNDTTRNAIEEVVWNLGGAADSHYHIPTSATSEFYAAERGTTVYTGRPTTWTGKVGLMYPSDYGYATAGGSTTNRTTCLSTVLFEWNSSSDCYHNDYLFNGSYLWTLTPYSADASGVYYVYAGSPSFIGNVDLKDANYSAALMRPALFLKSNIKVKSGTGESSDPYQLLYEYRGVHQMELE